MGPYWIWIVLMALGAGSVLASVHLSIRGASRAALEALIARKGRRPGARRVERILADTKGHAASIALPRVVASLVVLGGLVLWVADLRGDAAPGWSDWIIGLVAASVLIWVFGVVVPTAVAQHAGARTVWAWSWLVRLAYVCTRPARFVVGFLDEVVRRLAGAEDGSGADAREAALLSVVEEGERAGQFDQRERDMIERVLDLRQTSVEQIMTPRTEVDAIDVSDGLDEVTRFIRQTGRSRIPVYEENLDHVLGMLYAKDLLAWLAQAQREGEFRLRSILREALFVPETKTVRELLAELIGKKLHIAMVADEYGGTSGLVTLEDIVEEVFGEIWDEYEQAEEQEAPSAEVDRDRRVAEADARMEIDALNHALEGIGLEAPEGEEYDTLAGFVLTTLGRIPDAGESFRHDGLLITVLEAEPTRVVRVRIEPVPDASGLAPEEAVRRSRQDSGAA